MSKASGKLDVMCAYNWFVFRVVEFSDEPAGMILYEGVFFSRSQAECYLITHTHSVRHDNALHHHKCIRAQLLIYLSVSASSAASSSSSRLTKLS